MCAFQLLDRLDRLGRLVPAELLSPSPPPSSSAPPAQEVSPPPSRTDELLGRIGGLLRASQLASESHPFSRMPGGVARSTMLELSGPAGCGKTETVLRLLVENPLARAAWIESELTFYPGALARHGIPPERLLFCAAGNELVWCAQQILRSGLFEFVIVVPPVALAPTELRRLQLATEQGRASTILVSDKPTAAGAWTLRQQFQVVRSHWDSARIHPLKSRRSA